MKKYLFFVLLTCIAIILIAGCATSPKEGLPSEGLPKEDIPIEVLPADQQPTEPSEPEPTISSPSITIASSGTKNVAQLTAFFFDNNPNADEEKVRRLAYYYIDEGYKEGINSDIAFTQMCLETGFLRFGGLVQESMNNFCGLGAMDSEHTGEVFETEEMGVRAHIQHLHAYGTTGELTQPLIDKRYRYVNPRGKAPTVYELAGTWASDKQYGEKLFALLSRLSEY